MSYVIAHTLKMFGIEVGCDQMHPFSPSNRCALGSKTILKETVNASSLRVYGGFGAGEIIWFLGMHHGMPNR